jgi:hypothetical protein
MPWLRIAAVLLIAAGTLASAQAGLSRRERVETSAVWCWDRGWFPARSDGICYAEDHRKSGQPARAGGSTGIASTIARAAAAMPDLKAQPLRLVCPLDYLPLTRSDGTPACGKDLVEPQAANAAAEDGP